MKFLLSTLNLFVFVFALNAHAALSSFDQIQKQFENANAPILSEIPGSYAGVCYHKESPEMPHAAMFRSTSLRDGSIRAAVLYPLMLKDLATGEAREAHPDSGKFESAVPKEVSQKALEQLPLPSLVENALEVRVDISRKQRIRRLGENFLMISILNDEATIACELFPHSGE